MSVCGPNVTPAVSDVWRRIQTNFGTWGWRQKANACIMLIQPIVYQPRSPIQLTPESIQELQRLGRPVTVKRLASSQQQVVLIMFGSQ